MFDHSSRKGRHHEKMDAELIGRVSVLLGGGRHKPSDPLDFAVGIPGIKKIGEHVGVDEPLLLIHARTDRALASVLPMLDKAIQVT